MRYLLLFIFFNLNCAYGANFGLTFFSNRKVLTYPTEKEKKDPTLTIVVENKLLTQLMLQVIDGNDDLIGNLVVMAGRANHLIIKNNHAQLFIRPIQPSSEKIPVSFNGSKIEIP